MTARICLLLLSSFAAWGGERLNVLFIAADDLRPQLRCYGHPQMITPNLDALAESGMLFERAYCSAPTCRASRLEASSAPI